MSSSLVLITLTLTLHMGKRNLYMDLYRSVIISALNTLFLEYLQFRSLQQSSRNTEYGHLYERK